MCVTRLWKSRFILGASSSHTVRPLCSRVANTISHAISSHAIHHPFLSRTFLYCATTTLHSSSSFPVVPTCLIVRFSDSGSNPESGPNSPPTVNNSQASPTTGSNTAIQEVSFDSTVFFLHHLDFSTLRPVKIYHEISHSDSLQESENPAYGGRLTSSSQQGSLSDLSLFSSPSMPNISLGRPHVPSSSSVSI